MRKAVFAIVLTFAAASVHALTLPFADQFNNTSLWNTMPYTAGGVTAPAPTVDATQNSPGSTGGALRFTFPQGWPPGYEPGKAWSSLPQIEEVWAEYWFKFSDDFQLQPITNKHVYWVLGTSNSREGDYTLMTNGSRKMWMVTQPIGGTATGYYANLGYDPTIDLGVWYKATTYAKLNTGGQSNGIFRMWLNDRQVMDHTNVIYRTATYASSKLGQIELVPVWGGLGGPNKQAVDYFWIDAFRMQATPFDPVDPPDPPDPPDPAVPGKPGTLRVLGGKFRMN